MANIFCKFGAHGIVDVNNGVGKTKKGCQYQDKEGYQEKNKALQKINTCNGIKAAGKRHII
jgi:hypothetical protein